MATKPRVHRAARARKAVLAGSMASFTAITGALVVSHLPTTLATQSVAAVGTASTTPTTGTAVTAAKAATSYSSAVSSATRTTAAPVTASRGS